MHCQIFYSDKMVLVGCSRKKNGLLAGYQGKMKNIDKV
jgi:hypothetical protein